MPHAARALHLAALLATGCAHPAITPLDRPTEPPAVTAPSELHIVPTNAPTADGPARATPFAPVGLWTPPVDPSQPALLFDTGHSVLASWGAGAALFHPGQTRPARSLVNPSVGPAPVWQVATADLVLRMDGSKGVLEGLDPETGAERFRTRVFQPGDGSGILAAARAGDIVVVCLAHGSQFSTRFVALDARDGRALWHAGGDIDPNGPRPLPVLGGAVLTVDPPGGQHAAGLVRALDLRTGRERWRYTPGGIGAPALLGWDENAAYVALTGDEVVAVAAESGRSVAHLAVPGVALPRRAVSRDGVLYISGYSITRDGWYVGTLVAMDLATGRERWRAPAGRTTSIEVLPAPVLLGGTLVHCGYDGTLRAHDVATGTELSRVGLGLCVSLLGAGQGEARGVYAVDAGNRVLAFAPGRPFEQEVVLSGTARLDGEPWPGARVRVGDAWVRTDAAGAFHLRVRGAGWINIEATGGGAVADLVRLDLGAPGPLAEIVLEASTPQIEGE